jgi:hypothetical protein
MATIQLQHGGLFDVQLDLKIPSFSTCSCSKENWCAHRIAVFFESYSELVSIQEWIKQWKTVPEKTDPLMSIPGVMRASDLLKARQSEVLSPDGWTEKIREAAREHLPVSSIYKNPYLLEYEGKKLYELLMKSQPSKREWQPLYQLYTSFGLFAIISELFGGKNISPELLQRSCSSFLFYLVEEAADAADEISVHALPFEFDDFIYYLLKETEKLLTSEQELFPVERLDLYRHLWATLFKREAWRKQEIKRLDALMQTEDSTIYFIAYLHQLYVTNQLEDFAETAARLPKTSFDFFMYWLYDAFSNRQHDKALLLLKIADQKLEEYLQLISDGYKRRQFVHWFLNYIDTDWLIAKEPAMFKRLLLRLLPYSYVNLSNYFMSTAQFHEWVELQLWMNYELPELDAMGLKEAGKHAPEAVLAVYHHGILMLLEQRNRDSYKKAVRYLKRLRTIYKKLKKSDRWERYFTVLLEDTKRLRAFHEECRKGKLTDA